MNIYNWILAPTSPWSDEYHSLFIRPLLIFLYPASITAGHGADNDDDAVNRGEVEMISLLVQCVLNKNEGLTVSERVVCSAA